MRDAYNAEKVKQKHDECNGNGKSQKYETIAYNDALRNIQRLIVEDRVFIATQFPEGREGPCFIDDYQDENDKWHCALTPWDGITAKNPEERRQGKELGMKLAE